MWRSLLHIEKLKERQSFPAKSSWRPDCNRSRGMAFGRWKKDGKEAERDAERIENRTSGLLNFVVALATAAVAYTDWAVVSNVSLGYLYVLPLALCAVVNRLPVTVG